MPRQLPLPLPHDEAMGSDDFLPVPGNVEALRLIERWPDWPNSTLALCGPEKSGKTHLLSIWLNRSRAVLVSPLDLTTADRSQFHHVAIDDAAGIAGDAAAEEALFHLYNHLKETKGSLLLTARTAPAAWGIALPDLHSRLATATVAMLGELDRDDWLSALLVKQLHDRQLTVDEGVIAYILPRIERSPAAVTSLVAELDRMSLAEGRAITVPLARRLLDAGGLS